MEMVSRDPISNACILQNVYHGRPAIRCVRLCIATTLFEPHALSLRGSTILVAFVPNIDKGIDSPLTNYGSCVGLYKTTSYRCFWSLALPSLLCRMNSMHEPRGLRGPLSAESNLRLRGPQCTYRSNGRSRYSRIHLSPN